MLFNLIPEKSLRIMYTLLLCAGALIIGWSILVMQEVKPPEPYYHTTTGLVHSSRPVGSGQFQVRVEYSIPGRQMEGQMEGPVEETLFAGTGTVEGKTVVESGDTLLVHYNPYSPEEFAVQVPPPVKAEYLIFFGILIGGLGFRFFIRSFFRNAKRQFIQENGRKITPHSTEIEKTYIKLLWIVRVHVIRIHCTWKRTTETEELNFYSEPYPPSAEAKLKLQNAKVCFLPQAPERYFIEV